MQEAHKPQPKVVLVNHSGNHDLKKYEASEHRQIGNAAFDIFCKKNTELKESLYKLGLIDPDVRLMTLSKHVSITAGDWVALAGDFYGDPDHPISGMPQETVSFDESKNRFTAAYETLANINEDGKTELEKLLKEINAEEAVVKKAIEDGENVHDVLHARAAKSNVKFSEITAKNILAKTLIPHLPLAIIGLTIYTRYLALAENNFDHFGKDAEIAYRAGHEVALQTAAKARLLAGENNAAAKKLLVVAFTQELFACHFLTDLFSAGHLRVPRKELYRHAGGKIGGALSLMMHNEDNEKGLVVTSEKHNKESWLAKGDGCLYDKNASLNRLRAIEAVTDALQSVSDTFFGKAVSYNFKEYIPSSVSNSVPLFKTEKGTNDKVECRADLTARESDNYLPSGNWKPIPTLVNLWFLNKKHGEGDEKALEKELQESSDDAKDEKTFKCSFL